MEHRTAVALVEREAALLAAALAPRALGAAVPGCPGWTLADLARHTGGVHRWATAALAVPPDGRPGHPPAGPARDDAVREWFADGAAALASALAGVAPDAACWTMASAEAPRTAAFWVRRQVHETAVHRWDAQCALAAAGGGPAPDPASWLEEDVAADGVAEVAAVMAPRQVRLGRTSPLPGALVLEGPAGRSALGAGEPVAVLSGPAPALLLLLWGRTGLAGELDAGRLSLRGDRALAERVLAGALTP